MKKVKYILLLLFLLCPLTVKASNQDDVNAVKGPVENALRNNEWLVSLNNDTNLYSYRINLDLDEKYKGVSVTIRMGPENANDSLLWPWNLLWDENGAYLQASEISLGLHEIFQSTYSFRYNLSISKDSCILFFFNCDRGELEESGTFDKSDGGFNYDNLEDYEIGTMENPDIIMVDDKTITIPNETQSANCYFFQFDYSEVSNSRVARYIVEASDESILNNIKWQNYVNTFQTGLLRDAEDDNVYQAVQGNTYSICGVNQYAGETISFSYLDDQDITYFDDHQKEQAQIQSGVINTTGKDFNPDPLCGENGENCDIDLNNVCNTPTVARTLKFLGLLLFILKILVPAIIIIMGFVNLFNIIVSSKPEEAPKYAKSIVLRVVIGIIIFLAPTIVNFVFDTVNNVLNGKNESSFENCKNCILDTDKCKVFDN